MTPAPLAIAVALFLTALPARAADAGEEAAVRAAALSLFDSWREADRAKGDRVLHPHFRLTTWRETYDGDKPEHKGEAPYVGADTRERMMAIYDHAKAGEWDDRLTNLAVHVYPGKMAVVWADYGFFIEGRLSHCGAVTLQLYRTSAGWQIVNFADTHQWVREGQAPACAAEWK